jgi:hypothetical protein
MQINSHLYLGMRSYTLSFMIILFTAQLKVFTLQQLGFRNQVYYEYKLWLVDE